MNQHIIPKYQTVPSEDKDRSCVFVAAKLHLSPFFCFVLLSRCLDMLLLLKRTHPQRMQGAIRRAVTVLQMRIPCLEGLKLKVWLFDVDVFQHAFRMVWTSRWEERLLYHKGGCKLARDGA